MQRRIAGSGWMSGGLEPIRRFVARPLADPLAEAVAGFVTIPLLLAVALWNRFPIIFYDTGAYLMEGIGRVFLAERSPVYSLFLSYGGGGASLWIIALLQAAGTSFVMVESARCVAPRFSLQGWLALVVALVVLTGLPWYAGQIEPDCLAPLVVLGVYLLAFHVETLGPWRRGAMTGIVVFAIAAHPSHLLLGGGLVLAMAVYWGLARPAAKAKRGSDALGGVRMPALLRPALCCLSGLVLIMAANFQLTGTVFVSRSGPAFVFARLLQDRIVMRLLDDTCPGSHYRLCAYKDVLPRTANQWLWGRGSPFLKLDRFEGTAAESSRIIRDSLMRYPAMQIEAALADSVGQFAMFRTGDQIEAQQWVLKRPLSQYIPGQIDAYLAARQQQGEMDFGPVNAIHVPFGWLALAALAVVFVLCIRAGRRDGAVFLGVILCALIGNAVICGALSNPHDRYQSRLIWLAPFAVALIAGDRAIFALRGWGESGT